MAFNENTRVKIPAMLHLCRLGYKYISLSKAKWNIDTNFFIEIFEESIQRINPKLEQNNIKRLPEEISLVLDNEEIGGSLYKMLVSISGTKLIDFKNFNNNSFHVVTELNRKNNLLKAKYENDAKNARMNKRILKKGKISIRESEICETLMGIKKQMDEKELINTQMLNNESYFDKLMNQMVIGSYGKNKIELDPESAKYNNTCLVK